MAFYRSLRNIRTRISPPRPPRSAKPVQADIGPWGTPTPDYISPPAQSYEPHPGLPEFPDPEYGMYDPGTPHHSTPIIRDPGPEDIPFIEATPYYDDSLMTDELYAKAMCDAIDRPHVAEVIALDHDTHTHEIMNGQGALEELVADSMINDPSQASEAMFEQQMQEPFCGPATMQPDLTPPGVAHDFLGAGNLEAIVGQEMNSIAAMAEIEAAIDHQMQPVPEPMPVAEPQPEPSLYVPFDNYMQMYEEQIQEMMESYGMPGPMGPMM